jgi:hypothetical protein
MTAITTYGTLKTAIAAKMNRTDLTAEMPGFVTNAEAGLNSDVRHPRGEYLYVDWPIAAELTSLPTDYLEMISVSGEYGGGGYHFDFDGPVGALTRRGSLAGMPIKGVSVIGTQLRASPPPNGTVSVDLHYYKKLDTITGSDAGTNWLLVLAPDIYLYRSLMEAAVHMRDAGRLAEYGAAYQGALTRVNRAGKKYASAVGMQVRPG